MNFNFTKEEEQFIDEVKSFIDEEKKKLNADDVFAPNREADAQTKIDSPARRVESTAKPVTAMSVAPATNMPSSC